jgi:putative tryptophan/tyrosine transport system substrate-binding protein
VISGQRQKKIMDRKIFCLALCALLFALCVSAQAQQPKKVPRIGYISSGDQASESTRAEAIRLALRELGYIEGQNIATEYQYAEGKRGRFPERAAELVRLKVDIIVVAGGSGVIQAAKNATKTIPIVMAGQGLGDPVKAGLVESLARPGGNVTGITNLTRELGGKRLELLKDAVPKITRVAVLYESVLVSAIDEVKEIQAAARTLGLKIQPWEVRAADGFERVFAALNKQRPDGLYVLQGTLMSNNQKRTVVALKSQLPSMYNRREDVEAGGLISYGADQADSYRRVAYYVDKILKGAKPADLPVEQPTKFELVINLKTAKQIGLTIPQNLLVRADKVIR